MKRKVRWEGRRLEGPWDWCEYEYIGLLLGQDCAHQSNHEPIFRNNYLQGKEKSKEDYKHVRKKK